MPQSIRRIDLKIDVAGSVKLPGKIEIAATAFLPDPKQFGQTPIAMFAFPGGGYSLGYYDMHIAGHEGYSEGEFHAGHGIIFVALDHLGVGESTLARLDTLQIEDIAAANHAAVSELMLRIEKGTLAQGFAAVPKFFKIGTGQSMGAGLTMLMQGRHRTYQAIAPFGFSAIHTVLPQPGSAASGVRRSGDSISHGTDPTQLDFSRSSSGIDFIYPFHWEDVPKDILAADLGGGYPIRKTVPKWGSATIPNCVIAMMSPGFVSKEAASIEVPVLMGMGERDVIPTPLNEPSAFKRAMDVSLFIVPRMAHMQNFAGTRRLLWERLLDWSRMVAPKNGCAGAQ